MLQSFQNVSFINRSVVIFSFLDVTNFNDFCFIVKQVHGSRTARSYQSF